MAVFYFQERSISKPTYRVEAETLEDAFEKYQSGDCFLNDDEIVEASLTSVFDKDDNKIEVPKEWLEM